MQKQYDHTREPKIYEKWEKSGAFKPSGTGKPYSILMPPPNANGALHIGHAMFAIEDTLIRYHRMNGFNTVWIPGADHAGFETQVVYEKKLAAEGRDRFKISRDKLYLEMSKFVLKNKQHMYGQLKRLGLSADWSKERFTLDPEIIKIVYRTFKQLYDDDLVYRGERIINWCTHHQTSLSDLEVAYETQTDPLYFVKYRIKNGKAKDFVTVATTRPETIFADQAIAINPKDKRAKKLVGQLVQVPLTDRFIPIIADEAVDLKFGTGMVKITPAHDPLDHEIGQRHTLVAPQAIDFSGHLSAITGKFAGLTASAGRVKVAEALRKDKLLEKVDEKYSHTVGRCYKCKTLIEPLLKPQWFVAMTRDGKSGKNLRGDALKALYEGKIRFVTPHSKKTFAHWLENLRDWNISRQIVWGIQLPVWYCAQCNATLVSETPLVQCSNCRGAKLTRESDVFDTWFSSGQWPFAATKSLSQKDFETFYPTSVMETGYDILFFWVTRMIMLSLYVTDEVPFRDIYLHGLVRDKDKKKMSKSKGNVVDPLGVIDQYGADALRGALVAGNSAGADASISEEKIAGYRNFSNKLWNIARFILDHKSTTATVELSDADKAILHRASELHRQTTKLIESYNFGFALQKIREFVWHELADRYIEETKATRNQAVLEEVLEVVLKVLHPFMPFVTEEIWGQWHKDQLITTDWSIKEHNYPNESKSWAKAELGSTKVKVVVIDPQKITEELEGAVNALKALEARLINKQFLAKAPKAVVAKEKSRQKELQDKIAKLTREIHTNKA